LSVLIFKDAFFIFDEGFLVMFYRYIILLLGIYNMMFSLGLKEFVFEDAQRIFDGQKRRLEVAVWYSTQQTTPTEKIDVANVAIWKIKDVIRNGAIESGLKLPLIIFSHGYSGNQWANTWFPEALAAHGYMVASVRHYGNSTQNMIPEISVRAWNRPQDLRFVLDQLLQQPELQDHIDVNRIGAAGFSQGGVACMWLAGVQADLSPENLKQQITMVNNPEYKPIHFKDIPVERLEHVLDYFTDEDFDQANKSYYDPRFKAVFVMAPGIDEENFMFKPEGLAQSKTPMHIIVGQDDEGVVEQSIFFAQNIPHCAFTLIPGHVGHMTLLNEGTQEGKINRPYLTVDHPSVDREKVHAFAAAEALKFFNSCLQSDKVV
jgi:predicted dienelactone hydrolase